MEPQSQQPISERVKVNRTLTTLTITSDGKLQWTNGRERSVTVEKEVLGFGIDGLTVTVRALVNQESGFCCIVKSQGIRRREDFVFEFLTEDSMTIWCTKLQELIDLLDRPKRLFIIVNPFGGKKSASKVFNDEVKPLLDAANIQCTVQETKYQLHAKEIAQKLNLSSYDGVVCVSGDGVLVEVINGLLQRKDWKSAIKVPLGIVCAGTGNGMVKSLLDSVDELCSVTNAVLTIIRGHKRPLDVATVLQGETRFFSVLMLAWGLVADIDIESEKYRWMGSLRLDFYGLVRVLRLRRYNGRVSFVPAPGYESYGTPRIGPTTVDSKDQEETVKMQECTYQGSKASIEEKDWRIIDGPFISVWLHNVPWASEDAMAAPNAQFSDGYLDLIIMKDCSRSSLLTLFSKMSDGSYVKSPDIVYLKVKALILEPGHRADDPSKGGIIDSDGEVLARGKGTYKCEANDLMSYGPMNISVDRGLATLFCPSPS
ncbi:sphingosine kinase [Ranunculus cassubicifolius]